MWPARRCSSRWVARVALTDPAMWPGSAGPRPADAAGLAKVAAFLIASASGLHQGEDARFPRLPGEDASVKSTFPLSFKCLLAFALALGSTSWPGMAALDRLSTSVERTLVHLAGTPEATAVAQWLEAHKDVHPRTLAFGTVTIRHRCESLGRGVSPVDAASLPFPARGAPGEKFTITNELPGIGSETWRFVWTGEGRHARWRQVGYGWHVGVT